MGSETAFAEADCKLYSLLSWGKEKGRKMKGKADAGFAGSAIAYTDELCYIVPWLRH
jgi:hypothetical protein